MKKYHNSITKQYSLAYLASLPTLAQGHTDDLKIETKDTRVWLSRMTIEDDMEYNNQVTIEEYKHPKTSKGVDQTQPKTWQIVKEYEAK